MRVIAGEFRSRRLISPPGLEARPTPDRLRESLFNILAPRIEGVVFADCYAGCGAVGIEALSRGASRAVFIERNPACARVIESNLASFGLAARARVIRGGVTTYLRGIEAGIYFLDPPYEAAREYEAALAILGERSGHPVVIAQHSKHHSPGEAYGNLRRRRTVRQGDNCLSFYETTWTES